MKVNLRDFSELLKRLEELKSFYTDSDKKPFHYLRINLIEDDKKLYMIEYNVYRDEYSSKTTLDNPYIGLSTEEIEDLREEEKKYNKTILFGKKYKSSMELVMDLKIMLKAKDSEL